VTTPTQKASWLKGVLTGAEATGEPIPPTVPRTLVDFNALAQVFRAAQSRVVVAATEEHQALLALEDARGRLTMARASMQEAESAFLAAASDLGIRKGDGQ
jgi:hypothetical protein